MAPDKELESGSNDKDNIYTDEGYKNPYYGLNRSERRAIKFGNKRRSFKQQRGDNSRHTYGRYTTNKIKPRKNDVPSN